MLLHPPSHSKGNCDPHRPFLSIREKQIVEELSQDLSVKMIACQIGISEYTVQDYIKRLKQKLRLHTAAGIVAKCLRDGIIE